MRTTTKIGSGRNHAKKAQPNENSRSITEPSEAEIAAVTMANLASCRCAVNALNKSKVVTGGRKIKQRLRVRKLPFGDSTSDGSFYPVIDGAAWGEDGRAFWPTKAEAMSVGIRCFNKVLGKEHAIGISPQRDGGDK